MTTYYLTRYALSSQGAITSFEADGPPSESGYVRQRDSWWTSFKIGRDAHATPEGAIAAAEAARTKKIASLRKQIAALEKMVFTVKEKP